MSYRAVENKDLVGKTIKKINSKACNALVLEFDDGTKLTLWAEMAVNTSMGGIPGIFVNKD